MCRPIYIIFSVRAVDRVGKSSDAQFSVSEEHAQGRLPPRVEIGVGYAACAVRPLVPPVPPLLQS